jgi:hypothetical protein
MLLGLVLTICLLVVPAVVVALFMHRQASDELAPPVSGDNSRVVLAVIIAGVAVASIAFRMITGYGLQQTAALFIGIPAVLAIVTVFAPTPRSATGIACKAVTIGLLVSLIFLGEGLLCILLSAPLFYAVALVIGLVVDYLGRKSRTPGGTVMSCAALLALVPMSLEGVTAGTSFNREVFASETRIVRASAGAVERALREQPRFDRALPPLLRFGFPSPISVRIDRDRWVIRMRGGETRLDGMEPREGDLVLSVDASRPGVVQWTAASDDSHMTHFLLWRSARVEWEAIDAENTRVTWTLRYRRGLDPAWYFGPMQYYAVQRAAGYLIDAVATP